MREETDVLVIGGGPCGSFSALTAAKLGAEVLVCEEHRAIGLPQHCTGHLNIRGLELLGLQLPSAVIENEIRGVVFHSPFGKELCFSHSSPVTYVVDRERFDKYLADLAVRSGVRYALGFRVQSVAINPKGAHANGIVRDEGRTRAKAVCADLAIDAEGAMTTLLRKPHGNNDLGSAVQAIQARVDKVNDVDLNTVEVYLGRTYAPGFYAWIVPRKDGSAKVGLATWMGNPRSYLERFFHAHPVASQKLQGSNITDLTLHPIPLGGPLQKTFSHRRLIVGDAASQAKPTTGGGVIPGLLCAKIAGKVAHEALSTQEFTEAGLSSYQFRWKKILGFDFEAMRIVRSLLNQLPDKKMDRIMRFCARIGVDDRIIAVSDLDFQGRSLLRMVRHPKLLMATLYFIVTSALSFGSVRTPKP